MPLTLRRTGLSRDPDADDWNVIEKGEVIGRIYEDMTASRPAIRWFWAHNLLGQARATMPAHGRAATFEDAKMRFAAALEAFREWKPKDSDCALG
jgi:hypothetical protein